MADASFPSPTSVWRFGDEPSSDEYAEIMGLDTMAQANNFAKRAISVLAQQYFSADDPKTLDKATELFDMAFRQDPECALAHAGVGFLQLTKGEPDKALASFERAERADPSSRIV